MSHLHSKGSESHDSVSTGKATASVRNERKEREKRREEKKGKHTYRGSSQSRALSAHTWLAFAWHIFLVIQIITSKNEREKKESPWYQASDNMYHRLWGLGNALLQTSAILGSPLETLFLNAAFDHIFKT